ncbi:MAG: hypothetical protein MZU97_10675 [Bacillus subtilis]|nr:hypothetical protein [Bacillus subtilis]
MNPTIRFMSVDDIPHRSSPPTTASSASRSAKRRFGRSFRKTRSPITS